LQGLDGEEVLIEEDGQGISIPLGQIAQARLVPEY
jgi:ribosome maturation factor RimP